MIYYLPHGMQVMFFIPFVLSLGRFKKAYVTFKTESKFDVYSRLHRKYLLLLFSIKFRLFSGRDFWSLREFRRRGRDRRSENRVLKFVYNTCTKQGHLKDSHQEFLCNITINILNNVGYNIMNILTMLQIHVHQ